MARSNLVVTAWLLVCMGVFIIDVQGFVNSPGSLPISYYKTNSYASPSASPTYTKSYYLRSAAPPSYSSSPSSYSHSPSSYTSIIRPHYPGAYPSALGAILEDVQNVVAEQLGVDKAKIQAESNFIKDLGADSLDSVELVMALEEKFGVDIPDEEATKITTVQQAVDYIEKHKKEVAK